MMNEERAAGGLDPLEWNDDVAAVARAHSICQRANGDIYHDCPYGHGSHYTRLDNAGVSYLGAGENVAWDAGGISVIMSNWMGSPGHRAPIMGEYTQVGVGIAQPNTYCTAVFIN